MRSLGIGTERLYCAIFQAAPVKKRTPDPRQGPRFGVSSVSSNQAKRLSGEKEIQRDTALKLHAFPFAKCGCAYLRNSSRVQRSDASVPRKTASGVKKEKYLPSPAAAAAACQASRTPPTAPCANTPSPDWARAAPGKRTQRARKTVFMPLLLEG